MTEKLFTGTLNHNQNKNKNSIFSKHFLDDVTRIAVKEGEMKPQHRALDQIQRKQSQLKIPPNSPPPPPKKKQQKNTRKITTNKQQQQKQTEKNTLENTKVGLQTPPTLHLLHCGYLPPATSSRSMRNSSLVLKLYRFLDRAPKGKVYEY